MTPLERESMVAALGLDRILKGTTAFTQEVQADAVSFPKRARAALLRFLSGTEQEPEDMPPFDWHEAKGLLDNVSEAQNQALFDALPDDIQDEVLATATLAIQHLQATLPRRVTRTAARVDVLPPEPFELGRFERAWLVAIDPLGAIKAMTEGSLDMGMVAALAAMYPALYKLIAGEGGLLDDAIATMKARRGENWDITEDQNRQVKILIQDDPIDFDLAADFEALSPAAMAPPPKASQKTIEPSDELLPSQKQ